MRTIALIAHDGKKPDMIAFARRHADRLASFDLVATGTTGGLIADNTGLTVERVRSGPIGGDVEIAARVIAREIAAVFFFVDPLDKHPHDPDIRTLLRACDVCDVPIATNPATARLLIGSDL